MRIRELTKYIIPTSFAFMAADGYRIQLRADGVLNSQTAVKLVDAQKACAEFEAQTKTSEALRLKQDLFIKGKGTQLKENLDALKKVEDDLVNSTGEAKIHLEAKKKELDKKVNDTLDDILKSDLSAVFKGMYEKYALFLDGLSLDQIVAVFNLIIDLTLSISIFSILSLFMSEFLIDYFNLEKNFPSLAQLIRLRKKLNNHLKVYNLAFFIFFLALGVFGNLYMFLLNYF